MNGANVLVWTKVSSWALMLIALLAPAWAADDSFQVGPFRFSVPEGWERRAPSSPMRQAELRAPDGQGEAAFFFFKPGDGGSPQDNITRWLGQVTDRKEEKVETERQGNHQLTFVRARGTYASGMPGGPLTPLPDTLLLGAILESPAGNVFIRMTGPYQSMAKAEETFRAMVRAALTPSDA
ncbi:MAG: hypothetical protein SNJ84_05190 [Verrucomicrobiia bacterium]